MLSVSGMVHPGLQPVSFTINDGEILVVRGPSGAGKTLLLRSIADLDPNEGEVKLDGQDRSAFFAPEWRKQVTFVPAEPGWWAERVIDHFSDWSKALPYLKQLNLPQNCGDWSIMRLSTGERQRLGLIRALVLNPKVLLLDEPTSALDPDTTTVVESIIKERLKANTCVLWTSHNSEQAHRLSKRCLSVNEGRVTEELL